jgi:serine/threonine-protein kinase
MPSTDPERSLPLPGAPSAEGTTTLTPVAGDGPRWGRYLLKHRIGEGSYGVVFRAFDSDLQRDLAIKLLHPWIDEAHELRARVRAEGQALARVRHQNVVTVFGVEENQGQLGLCMEFVSGHTLDTRVRQDGTLNAAEASLVGREVCRALAAVHAANLVHRDVKARNVMREHAGRIVLMDFGAGLRADRSGHAPTIGTPHYMAPELFEGAGASRLTDVYSVGVLLYFLVTGRYPVEGETAADIRAGHRAGRRVPLRQRRGDLPASFVRTVESALAPAAARVADAGTLEEALEADTSRRRAWRSVAAWTAALAVIAVVSGVVTTFTFDTVIDRTAAFSQDTWLTRIVMGLRSMVFPLAVMGTFLLPRAAWNLARAILPRRKASRRGTSLTVDPVVLAHVLVVLGFAAVYLVVKVQFGAVLYAFLPAPGANLSEGDLLTFAPLDPVNRELRLGYRIALAGAMLALGIGWHYVLAKGRSHHATSPPPWIGAAGLASLGLLLLLLQAPYKVMAHNELPVVLVDGLRCSVVGERADALRVFCPGMPVPRVRTVTPGEHQISPCGFEDSVFRVTATEGCSVPEVR